MVEKAAAPLPRFRLPRVDDHAGMALALVTLAPPQLLPPFCAGAVLLWHTCRGGGPLFRCKVPTSVAAASTLVAMLLLLPVALQPCDPLVCVPRVVEVRTKTNSGRVALDDALVVVSSCVCGGRFDPRVISASLDNKRRYCTQSTEHRRLPVRCSLFDAPTPGQHHPKWEKYIRIRKEMEVSRDAWFMWIDCDAVFTNASFAWDSLLLGRGEAPLAAPPLEPLHDLVLARDSNGLNTGVFFLQNTPWSLGFLDAVLAMQMRIDDLSLRFERFRDQRAVDELLHADPSLMRRIRVVPQQLINAYFSHGKGHGAVWKQGDWIAHQVDCKRPECNAELEELAAAL